MYLVFINFYRFPLMLHGFNTSVFPESAEEVWEVWGAPERSGEALGGLGSSGQVRGAPERSREVWGDLWGGPGKSWKVRGGLGSSLDSPGPLGWVAKASN